MSHEPVKPAHVVFRLPDGSLARVAPGGIIGRSTRADLYLPDPRVSEAQAMVSLRGHRLKLIQLRRPIVVKGESFAQVTLKPGLQIELTKRLTMTVVEVQLPSHELVLCGVAEDPIPLAEERYAIVPAGAAEASSKQIKHERGPKLELWYTYADGALASIWSCTDGWALRVDGCEPDLVRPGSSWALGDSVIRFATRQRKNAVVTTQVHTEQESNICVEVTGDRVEFLKGGQTICAFTQVNGRILREIIRAHASGSSAYWVNIVDAVYGEINEASYDRRQDSFYKQLQRIRRKLKSRGLPGRVVRGNGRGEYGLDAIVAEVKIHDGG